METSGDIYIAPLTSNSSYMKMAPCKESTATRIHDSSPSNCKDSTEYNRNGVTKARPFRSVGSYGINNLSTNQNILYKILSKPTDEITTETERPDNVVEVPAYAKVDFLVPGDYRERSQSMGSTASPYGTNGDLSRTSSQDSLASIDSEASSHQLLEYTRTRLGRLLMAGSGEADSAALAGYQALQFSNSFSQPGTPPNASSQPPFAPRKHSEGSQRAYLKHKFMAYKQMNGCMPPPQLHRRKPYSRPSDSSRGGEEAMDEGIEICLGSDFKDLRERSNSLSVYETYRGGFGPSVMGFRRQRVTLAKKNLLPIVARVSDRLNKIIEFATSLPEFTRMPLDEQTRLLVGACPRLLLLYMAEMNLQFAVTPVPEAGEGGLGEEHGGPTLQFVDTVQVFIRKCQKNNVTTNEYFYMRMIALFHTGCVRDLSDIWGRLAECTHSEARQDLQELVQHTRPNDRQRYTTLLFTLLTLYSINSQMMRTLFCDPVFTGQDNDLDVGKTQDRNSSCSITRNLETFVRDRLVAAKGGLGTKAEGGDQEADRNS